MTILLTSRLELVPVTVPLVLAVLQDDRGEVSLSLIHI